MPKRGRYATIHKSGGVNPTLNRGGGGIPPLSVFVIRRVGMAEVGFSFDPLSQTASRPVALLTFEMAERQSGGIEIGVEDVMREDVVQQLLAEETGRQPFNRSLVDDTCCAYGDAPEESVAAHVDRARREAMPRAGAGGGAPYVAPPAPRCDTCDVSCSPAS